MFKNIFKLFLLNKLLGNGGERRRGGIGCFGVILILAILYFIYWFISG